MKWCLLCAVILGAFAKTSGQSTVKYSRGQADTVLTQFVEALHAYHPFANRGNGGARIDSAAEVSRAMIRDERTQDSLYLGDVIAAAGPIRATIGDGHLQFRPVMSKAFREQQRLHQYDLSLQRDDTGDLFLADSLVLRDSTVLPKGAQLLTLETRPIDVVVAEISAFTGVDDHDLRAAREWYPSRYIATFYQRTYGWHDSLAVQVLVDADTVPAVLYPETVTLVPEKAPKVRRRAQMTRSISLDTTAATGVYRLDVNSFSGDVLGKANPYRRLRKLIKEVDRAQASALIVDVRNNTGGSADLVDHLYGFIAREPYHMVDSMLGYTPRVWGKNIFERLGNYVFGNVRSTGDKYVKRGLRKQRKPKRRRHFDGDVIVLVNEITFSGGTAFAHYVQHFGRGRVVGQTSGGSAERMFAGDLFEVRIGPRKEFRINMPLWYMDMVGDTRGNVVPDVIVPRTRENQLDDSDPVLEAALELLQAE